MRQKKSSQPASKNTAAQQLGSKGGKVGGPARAKKLTSQERSQIASKGGQAKASKTKKPK